MGGRGGSGRSEAKTRAHCGLVPVSGFKTTVVWAGTWQAGGA